MVDTRGATLYGQPDIVFKLVLLGNVDVGKTALFKRITMGKFDDEPVPVDSKKIELEVQNTSIKILINDTAGQERFRTLTSSYFRNADGVLVVYDSSERTSFDDLEALFYEGSRYCERAQKFLIGNKLDLEKERVVTTEEGRNQSKELGASNFFEVSAKTNENVDELIQAIGLELLQRKSQETREAFDQGVIPGSEVQQHHQQQTKDKSKCC